MNGFLQYLVILLLSISSILAVASNSGVKQERVSPLLPDFRPFKHPAQKLVDESEGLSTKLFVDSPLSKVHWLEYFPVFGRIYTPQSTTEGRRSSNTSFTILGCITGLTIVIAVCYTKYGKNQQVKEQNCASSYPEEIKRECYERKCDEAVQIIQTNKIPETSEAQASVIIEQTIHKVEAPIILEKKETIVEKPDNSGVRFCDQQWIDEPNFSRKIKTFKLVKEPKSCQCEELYHGLISEVLNILEVMEFQRTEKLENMTKCVTANVDIEGANISRLRITDVREKDEEKLISKTMTVKEYMTLEANAKIEEAMLLVKQNCSVQNIKLLADTIKKYRPESQDTPKSL